MQFEHFVTECKVHETTLNEVIHKSVAARCCFQCVPLLLIRLDVELRTLAYWLIKPIKLRRSLTRKRKVRYTAVSRRVNRGVFALLQHWLAACQCSVTWCHTDGHVSETQTTRRAATSSQQTHTDTQQRPLEERGRKITHKTQSTTFWKYDSVEWIRLQCLRRPMHTIYWL